MTYRVLYFLSNFARNAKYRIILSGHSPFLTLTSGIDLLNDDQTLSFMTLGCCRATGIRSLQSQKVTVSQNFCLLSEFQCHNDRLKLWIPPPSKGQPFWASHGHFKSLLLVQFACSPWKQPVLCSCLALPVTTATLSACKNLNCALYFIFPKPGKLVVALRGPCPLLRAV